MSQSVESPQVIVIVGGVAGGASAATRARRMRENARIILFEKGPHVSFANCGLPYHLGGEITNRRKLLVATPEFLAQRFNLDVRVNQEVTRIDRERKVVTVQNHASGEAYEQTYDKLILAPGADPIVPPLDGVDAPNVFVLRNLLHMDAIKAAVRRIERKHAVIVGAGFIGLEMVEQLQRAGFQVALVELQRQVLPQIDPELAHMLESELQQRGIELHLGTGLQAVRRDANGVATGVELSDGHRIDTSLVVLGIGVRPCNDLAVQVGLATGSDGGIATGSYMQTSDPDVYAVGDAVQYVNGVTGGKGRTPLAGPANRAGRLAGQHAATGTSEPMGSVLGTAIVRVFDKTAAVTGLTQIAAARRNLPTRCVTIVANNHAGYYPGATPLVVKLVYRPDDGRLLGAQVVGADGVDKRIDVLAAAITMQATVRQIATFDLAYAPPFGSAKDALHMAAFAASNDLDGITRFLDAGADLTGMQILDVRTPIELTTLPVAGAAGAVNIPVDQLREHLSELDPQRPTAVICHVGIRAHVAARVLAQHGFNDVAVVAGGTFVRNHAIAAQH